MNIIDYCEKNNILWRPIKIEVSTAGKKKPKPLWGEMAIVGDWDNAEWVEKILPKRQESFRSISKAEQDKLWIAIDTRQIYQFDIDTWKKIHILMRHQNSSKCFWRLVLIIILEQKCWANTHSSNSIKNFLKKRLCSS